MKTINFIERLKTMISYDGATGEFAWLRPPSKPTVNPDRVGSISKGYRQICIDGKRYGGHVVAWAYVHGEMPQGQIDHINGVRSDNRIENLRLADYHINAQNRHNAYKNSKTGVLGAKWHKKQKKYVSAIRVNGKSLHLGTYETLQEARNAYLAAKVIYHPGYQPVGEQI